MSRVCGPGLLEIWDLDISCGHTPNRDLDVFS
jgi:hypothetical protein